MINCDLYDAVAGIKKKIDLDTAGLGYIFKPPHYMFILNSAIKIHFIKRTMLNNSISYTVM